jgi:hypothetical protein
MTGEVLRTISDPESSSGQFHDASSSIYLSITVVPFSFF